MIQVTPDIHIHESDLQEEFVRSSGPGGQNVNKVATAVKLRFDLEGSASLPSAVKNRSQSTIRITSAPSSEIGETFGSGGVL